MTRREMALQFRRLLSASMENKYIRAWCEEYDDLLAFLDAMENDGLVGAYREYRRYCDNQEG